MAQNLRAMIATVQRCPARLRCASVKSDGLGLIRGSEASPMSKETANLILRGNEVFPTHSEDRRMGYPLVTLPLFA
jgi:hypothetical protein